LLFDRKDTEEGEGSKKACCAFDAGDLRRLGLSGAKR
jgi:hypothetical protein